MAYSLTVAGYTFQNPPESYRKQANLGNNPQPAVDKEATDFYQSDSQDLQLVIEGTLALDPPLGESSDDLNELERLQDIAIRGGEVQVDFDPFFSGNCIIEDDPFRQSEGESSYKFTLTINSDTTDGSAYPTRNPPDTGNTFELGSLDLGYDPKSVSQNYERQTEQVKRLQGIARSIDNAGLVPQVRVSGMIDGTGQDELWKKARGNVLAYLSAEFQKGWCLIDSLSIRNSPEAPDYLDGLFRYDLDVLIVKDPSSGIGDVSTYVNQTVKRTGTYAGSSDSGDSSFIDLKFTVNGGSGSLGDDYIEWNETTLTLSDNDTNYVYVDDQDNDGYGQVKANQSAFPADALELYRVETSGGQIQKVVDVRAILIEDRDSEEGGDDGGETISGDVYFTVFGGDYEIVDGTASSWNDTRLLLGSNTRNYIWVEDPDTDGSAQVQTNTSGYPNTSTDIKMYRVDTDADSVTNIIDDRPDDISDNSTDTSDADLNLQDDLRVRDQNLSFERLLRLSDTLGITELDPDWLGIADIGIENLAVSDVPFEAQGITSLTDGITINDGGSPGGTTLDETITWGNASDWDNPADETTVAHHGFGDHPSAGTVTLGYQEYDPTGAGTLKVYLPMDDSSGVPADATGNLPTQKGNIEGSLNYDQTGLHDTTSINFPGNDNFQWDEDASYRDLDELTVHTWIHPDSFTNTAGTICVNIPGGSGSDRMYYSEYEGTSGDYEWNVQVNGNRYKMTIGSTPINTNQWNAITTRYRQSDGFMDIWVNGSQVATDTHPEGGGPVTKLSGVNMYLGENGENGSHVDGRMEAWRIIDGFQPDTHVQEFHDGNNGHLETSTKSFSGDTQPDLENLSYNLNGEAITLKVIGSPGTASEEVQTVNLDGGTSYSLSWASTHQDFRLRIELNSSVITTTPSFSSADLASGSGGGGSTTETTAWDTASDWDSNTGQKATVHETIGDHADATVELGMSTDPFGDGSLKALWTLAEDSSPSTFFEAVNGLDATVSGDPQSTAGVTNATAMDFDGGSDSGNAGQNPVMNDISSGTDFALAVWQKSTAGGQQAIVAGNGGGWQTEGFHLAFTGGKMRWEVDDSGSNRELVDDTSGNHGDGNWHLYVGVYSYTDSELRLYRDDGTLIGTTAKSFGAITSSYDWGIAEGQGYDSADNDPWTGTQQYVAIIKGRNIDAADVSELYDIITDGYLKTGTKSFSESVEPDLQNLTYSLNGETITLDVIGSPGTASEEIQTITLGGSSSYGITWNSSHQDFQVQINLDTATLGTSPTFSGGELVATFGESDADQNPNTHWEILGGLYDTQGNEFEGGGITVRYGG